MSVIPLMAREMRDAQRIAEDISRHLSKEVLDEKQILIILIALSSVISTLVVLKAGFSKERALKFVKTTLECCESDVNRLYDSGIPSKFFK